MNRTTQVSKLLVVAMAFLPAACNKQKSNSAPASPKSKLQVVVSLPPLADFVEHVAGEHATVEILVGPGQSAHHYEPTPQQITALSECDVYFRVGMLFEDALLTKIKDLQPDLNVVDLSEGITLRRLLKNEVSAGGADAETAPRAESETGDESEGDGHEHHEHAEHNVGAPDPHHWMDPQIAMRQIDKISQALANVDSPRASVFVANATQYKEELSALHAELTRLLAPFHGREFFVYHPAFGYFADAYRLTQVAIEFEGKEPSSQQLTRLVERARKAKVRTILTQPQNSRKGAEVIAEAIGAEVVIADPLPRDYLSELQALGFKLVDSFNAQKGGVQTTQSLSDPMPSSDGTPQ